MNGSVLEGKRKYSQSELLCLQVVGLTTAGNE